MEARWSPWVDREQSKALGLKMHAAALVFMKSVTDKIVALNYTVNMIFEVVGVLCVHSVYVGSRESTFTIILERRCLSQVKAMGDYSRETYIIQAADGYRAEVPRDAPAGPSGVAHVFRSEEYVRKMLQDEREWDVAWKEKERKAARDVVTAIRAKEPSFEMEWPEQEDPSELSNTPSSTISEYSTTDFEEYLDLEPDYNFTLDF